MTYYTNGSLDETVNYSYDPGGQLISAIGTRGAGDETIFVENIGYDRFGQS